MTGSGPSSDWPASTITPPGHRKPSRGRWDLAGIGWQAHIGGLAGGVLAGWIFRERRPKAAAEAAPVTGAPRAPQYWPARLRRDVCPGGEDTPPGLPFGAPPARPSAVPPGAPPARRPAREADDQ